MTLVVVGISKEVDIIGNVGVVDEVRIILSFGFMPNIDEIAMERKEEFTVKMIVSLFNKSSLEGDINSLDSPTVIIRLASSETGHFFNAIAVFFAAIDVEQTPINPRISIFFFSWRFTNKGRYVADKYVVDVAPNPTTRTF